MSLSRDSPPRPEQLPAPLYHLITLRGGGLKLSLLVYGDTLNINTDEAFMKFPQVDLEMYDHNNVIQCTP